jgi:hypothetical protein
MQLGEVLRRRQNLQQRASSVHGDTVVLERKRLHSRSLETVISLPELRSRRGKRFNLVSPKSHDGADQELLLTPVNVW